MNQFLKKHFLLSFILLISFGPLFSQSLQINSDVMDGALEERIEQDQNSYLRAYILLKDQVDTRAMSKDFESLRATKAQRGVQVVKSLQEKANATQMPLLREFTSSSEVRSGSVKSFWITNMIMIEASPAYLAELSFRPEILRIEQELQLSLFKNTKEKLAAPSIFEPGAREEGLTAIRAHQLWQMGYTGYGTKVLVLDSEIDFSHRALRTQFQGNNVPLEQAFTGEINGELCSTHGTNVTGLIVGLDRLHKDTLGVAFNAKYLNGPVPFSDEDGNTCTSNLTDIQNLQFALNPDGNPNTTDDIPDVINNSYGTPTFSARACQNITMRNIFSSLDAAGVSIIYAAGNDGPDESTLSLQPSYNFDEFQPLSIGSVDDKNVISSFSSRGPSLCLGGPDLIDPDIVAPGSLVRTTTPFNLYETISGTSFSAPYVAGAILLLKEAFPNLSGRTLNQAVLTSATDLGPDGDDVTYGNGLINVMSAYNWLVDQGYTPTPAVQSSNDIVLMEVQTKNNDCNRMIQSFVTVANNGSQAITEFDLNFKRSDSGFDFGSTSWQGVLEPGEVITFETDPVNAVVGTYEVVVEIDRVNGRTDLRSLDNVLKTTVNVISNEIEPTLEIAGAQICRGGQSILQATSNLGGTIRWYDAFTEGNVIAEGPSLLLENVQKDTTLYVSLARADNIGLERADSGPNTFLSQRAGLVFSAFSDFTLKSVKLFAEAAGPRIIQLRDERGNIQQQIVNISAPGEIRVDLDFIVTPGDDYELVMTVGNGLAVTTNQTNFPHEIEDIVRIFRSTGTVATFYAYFYDWEIEYDYLCGRLSANIEVDEEGLAPTVDFSTDQEIYTLNDQGEVTVAFTDQSPGIIEHRWSFGDGFSSIQANPSNVYTEPGTYVVTLYGTDANGCSNMAVKEVVIQAAVVNTQEQKALANQIQLFPNPVSDNLQVNFSLEKREEVVYRIVDVLGKTYTQGNFTALNASQERIPTNQLLNGTYFIIFQVGDTTVGKRFVKR